MAKQYKEFPGEKFTKQDFDAGHLFSTGDCWFKLKISPYLETLYATKGSCISYRDPTTTGFEIHGSVTEKNEVSFGLYTFLCGKRVSVRINFSDLIPVREIPTDDQN
ncbi:MAG: hypothetical protein ACTHMC_01630 [Pseudobacter sp.]|uniref:hypothetical protein n=1 Tax=Pseudobacter sp. TaxID=2045420 RepID=UPI003F7D7AEF